MWSRWHFAPNASQSHCCCISSALHIHQHMTFYHHERILTHNWALVAMRSEKEWRSTAKRHIFSSTTPLLNFKESATITHPVRAFLFLYDTSFALNNLKCFFSKIQIQGCEHTNALDQYQTSSSSCNDSALHPWRLILWYLLI